MNQSHLIRLTAEPSTKPGLQWLRLQLDERNGHAEALDQMVSNFNAPVAISDPSCTCNVPIKGQPARGWVEKLQVRAGLEGYELWAGVAWIDQLRDVCAEGKLWARVIVDKNSIDPRSGASLGAKLSSIELTSPPSLLEPQQKRETETMSTNTTTATILAALPRYRADAPNDCLALERAARELLPECKTMSHQDLYRDIIHPAIIELGAQKFVAASNRAGATVRASGASPEATATRQVDQSKPILDVSRYVGEPSTFAKIMRHVVTLNPGLKHDDAHQLAATLSRSHTIVG